MSTGPALERLAKDLRAGKRRCVELVESAIEARQASADPFGPYKTFDPDRARQQAQVADGAFAAGMDAGRLQGIPVSVKDLFGLRGWPTYGGTALRLPSAWEQEGPVMRAMRSQLAVMMGKTHMVELAFGGLGTNQHWGTPRNPWDREQHRVPGGSSAGAGVSLVEGSALIALGTDTAGSVRIPASMTGTVGLKTTVGRWPTEGVLPLSSTFDTVGILARTVGDAAFAFDGIEEGLFGLTSWNPWEVREVAGCRFGVPEGFFWEGLSPGIADAVMMAIRELEKAGASVVPLELEATEEAHGLFLQGGLAGVEVAAFLSRELPHIVERLDPTVRDRIRASETMLASEYLGRCSRFAALSRSAHERLATVDALLTPTVAISPPLVSDLQDLHTYRRCNLLALRNTAMANLLSLCALSIPVGLDALGLPVGLQLIAAPGKDRTLLQVGVAVERVLGTASERLPRNF